MKTTTNIKIQFLLFIVLLFPLLLFSQINKNGHPFIDQYTEEDFGNVGQVWGITQDTRGVMYFGCNYGLKTYNGKNWKSYNLPYSTIIKSLAVFDDGMLFYGAENDFGAIITDEKGKLRFYSFLINKLKKVQRDSGPIWKTLIVDNKVYFQSFKKIYYCDLPIKIDQNDSLLNIIKTIKPEKTTFHISLAVHNQLYVREWEKGLCILNNNKLELIPGGEQFSLSKVYFMLPLDDSNILIGTRFDGFYVYNTKKKKNAIIPFNLNDDGLIEKSYVYSGINLPNGNIAISTLDRGIVIINRSGEVLMHLNVESGLPDNYILSIFNNIENNDPNLWFGSNKGIFKVNISSPFTYWGNDLGISGLALSAQRFNGVLYIGTADGLYYLDELNEKKPKFKLIEKDINCWKLFVYNVPNSNKKKLLLGSETEIREVKGLNLTLIAEINSAYEFYQSEKSPENLYIGSNFGLFMLKYKNGRWSKIEKRDKNDLDVQIKSISEFKNYLAVGTGTEGVSLLESFNSENRIKIDSSKGLPLIGQDFILHKINGEIVIASSSGLYSIVDTSKVEEFAFFGNSYTQGKKGVFTFMEDNNSYWMTEFESDEDAKFQLVRYTGKEKLKKDSIFSKIISQEPSFLLYPDGEYVWVSNREGLYKFNKELQKDYTQPFNTLIVKVETVDDSLLYAGNAHSFVENYFSYEIKQTKEKISVLEYKSNLIAIEWAAPFFEKETETEFCYRLIGERDVWSKWDKKTEIRYTNLHEGDYTFEVKAKNIYNTVSSTAQYSFKILPPWYRTGRSYIIYGILFLCVVWLIVKLNTKRLQKDKERLESIVKERTIEIVKQKEKISIQRNNLDDLNKLLAVQKDQITAQRDEIKDELKDTLLKTDNLKKDLFKFQLKSIANQMNPHFMFNTLNAIKHFILQNDIETSDKYLMKFSKLMRITLYNSLQDAIPIADEIEALCLYLDLQRLQSGEKFDYKIKIDDKLDTKYYRIPGMLIQPFIENSLLHGIYNKDGKGEIKLNLIKEGNIVHCTIEDNGIGLEKARELAEKKIKGHVSVGTSLIHKRLKLISEIYKDNFYFKYSDLIDSSQESVGTKVDLKFPIIENVGD